MGARWSERSPAELALGYRWVVLIIALGAAVLTARQADAALAIGLILPVAGSALVTAALTGLAASPRVVIGLLFVDLVGGLVSIALTGGDASPFVIYVSASLVGIALRATGRLLGVALAAAIVGYVIDVVLAGATLGAGPIVDDIGGIAAAAVLIGLLGGRHPRPVLPLLNQDDRRLLRLLADRLTYAEIAADLSVSPEHTKVLIARLYRRLGARSRDEAVEVGRRLDVIG